MEENKTPRIF